MLTKIRCAAVLCLGGVFVLLSGMGGPALAHPHVWITDVTTYVFEGRNLIALRHRWEFDTFFSSFVIQKHDANGDVQFDAEETEALQAAAMVVVGYFIGDVGAMNQIVHLWKFADDADRREFWETLFADETFMAFARKLRPLIQSQENKLLLAAPWGTHP